MFLFVVPMDNNILNGSGQQFLSYQEWCKSLKSYDKHTCVFGIIYSHSYQLLILPYPKCFISWDEQQGNYSKKNLNLSLQTGCGLIDSNGLLIGSESLR